MFGWAKQAVQSVQGGLSVAVGTAEPVYGPDHIHPVVNRVRDGKPYTPLESGDLKWRAHDYTNVETQTFYFMADSGHIAMIQILYSNIVGVRTTAQFSTKVYHPTDKTNNIWRSTNLTEFHFDDEKQCVYTDNVDVSFKEDSFTIKAMADPAVTVNITMIREAPGFKIADDGTTYYGKDINTPWGHIRHVFWPRNKVEGSIIVNDNPIDFKGKGQFVMALQAMKPHHAASQWNLTSFHGPTMSAIMMEFISPPSYGTTKVTVGGIAKSTELIACCAENEVTHVGSKKDEEAQWDEPTSIKIVWKGPEVGGEHRAVVGILEQELGERIDRFDVMAEVPGFIKSMVGGLVGTRPYIYQYLKPATLKLNIGDEVVSEEGLLFFETSFIS